MNTTIIYCSTGRVLMTMSGADSTVEGDIKHLECEIPEGKIFTGIDTSVTPNVPIFKDIPKTELQLAQEQILATQAQLADLQEEILLKQNGGM